MLKLIIVVVSMALGAIAEEESLTSGQNLELEQTQQVIKNAIDELRTFYENNQVNLARYRAQIKHLEVVLREIFDADIMPKINEANDTINAAVYDIERKTVDASVDISECKKSAKIPEINSLVDTMNVCMSTKIQTVDRFDDETEKSYADGITRLKDILSNSENYLILKSFSTAVSAMAAAGEEATSAADEIIENLRESIINFIDTTWDTTFSDYDCNPTEQLEAIKQEVSNVIKKFESCVQQNIGTTSMILD